MKCLEFRNYAVPRVLILAIVFLGSMPVQEASADGDLLVFAHDGVDPWSSPPGAYCLIDGGVWSNDFGNNLSITYDGLPSGVHTVYVSLAEGYHHKEDPNAPSQVTNVASTVGVPRAVNVPATGWGKVHFSQIPYVTTMATVRDAWTMERIEGAGIEFILVNGWMTNGVFNKYPHYCNWAEEWKTNEDGTFPANAMVPTFTWDLEITNTGYHNLYVDNVITSSDAGDVFDLGTLYLTPIDDDTNGIADAWEDIYFAGSTNVDPEADADGDEVANMDEYIAGTNPTNFESLLCLENCTIGTNAIDSIVLSWPVIKWRTYVLLAKVYLEDTSHWWQVRDTWEVTNDAAVIEWEDTGNASDVATYMVSVVPWDYVGNTQREVYVWGGNTSTNVTTNGPPLP